MSFKEYYPERIPYKTHRLQVSELHEIYVEECGNPDGQPVLWCHGGPGGGIAPSHGRQFDPAHYRIILFDQRGAGKSTPFADVRENTTQDTISDIETIRGHLGIEKWIVSGRSWGTTLSLVYAETYPERVQALFLAAVFLCDKSSIHWLFQEGASRVYSEAWENFVSLVPKDQRHDIMGAYEKMLLSPDHDVALKAALAWSTWEATTCTLLPDKNVMDSFTSEGVMLALARFECHYLSRLGFLDDGQILRDAHKIAHIPTQIIHGRYDMNCLHTNAWSLHKALPQSQLTTVPMGAHSAIDPVTIDAQVRAADALKEVFGSRTPCPAISLAFGPK